MRLTVMLVLLAFLVIGARWFFRDVPRPTATPPSQCIDSQRFNLFCGGRRYPV